MKKRWPVGLVVEGNSTNSVILRLPNLAQEIGPIKSTAPRVARRLSNFLRAGYAVADYDQLVESQLILVRAPDNALPRIIEELAAAQLDFKSLCVVVCESWVLSAAFNPLREKGASIATVIPVAGTRRLWFVVEGDARALRPLRALIGRDAGRTIELRPGTKEFYFAAALLATALPIPLFAAAQQALRTAGISGKQLHALLGEMGEKMVGDFAHSSRIRWGGPLSECPPEIAESHFNLLRSSDPALSDLVNEALQFAHKHLPPAVRQS